MTIIEENLRDILKNAGNARLVAACKSQPQSAINEALALGITDFGENRLQEAQARWLDRPAGVRVHYIGEIQSRKVGAIVDLFDVIHTVDRVKLIPLLVKEMAEQRRHIPCFIQVNTGEEPQKGGVMPADLPAFYKACVEGGLQIIGLMCIPPADDSPAFHFGLLRVWARRLGLVYLSMGMSDDYEMAVRFGATHIRVGSGLFGARIGRKE